MDLSIVIPCRDEADNIPVLVRELSPVINELRKTRTVELVLIDDGSLDGTGDLLEQTFQGDSLVQILRHRPGRGLGSAVRTGLARAIGDTIVTTDCDATYPFHLIPDLLARLDDEADVVTASCYHPDGGVENVPGYRVFLSQSASLLYRILLDRRVHTYTCLFRAYRREVLEQITFKSDGFLSQTEILANAILAGFRIGELPCALRARRYGQSKARVMQIIRAHLAFQWGLIWSGRAIRYRQGVGVASAPERESVTAPASVGDLR